MRINSKFDYGDTIWWLHGNQVVSGIAIGMKGELNMKTGRKENMIYVEWGDQDIPFEYEIREESAFKTKKSLIKAMLGDNWQDVLSEPGD